jgi:hypothetical protein
MIEKKSPYLSRRAINCLIKEGLDLRDSDECEAKKAVQDFFQGKTRAEMLRVRGASHKTVNEIIYFADLDVKVEKTGSFEKAILSATGEVAAEVFKEELKKRLQEINFEDKLKQAEKLVKIRFEQELNDRIADRINSVIEQQVNEARRVISQSVEVYIRAEINRQIQEKGLSQEAARLVDVAINKMSRAV